MILIGNGKVFTRNNEQPYVEDGAILIQGNLIKDIGKTKELREKYPEAEFKDGILTISVSKAAEEERPAPINTSLVAYALKPPTL